jgi:hypothetical protein
MLPLHPLRSASALSRALATVICGCGVALLSSLAGATSVVQLNDDQLVRLSSLIAEGRVTSVRSDWNADRNQIFTTVTLRVSETYKGTTPGNGLLVLRLRGGQVGDLALVVSGQPTFAIDEDVIVFVTDSGAEAYPITGMFQGKFTIGVDPTTGAAMVQERTVPRDTFVRSITRIVSEEGGR